VGLYEAPLRVERTGDLISPGQNLAKENDDS